MTFKDKPLVAGLYLVSTPIGNADDITLRAIDVLRRADCLAAEDTRTARRLLAIHEIELDRRPLLAYHEHNARRQRGKLIARIEGGSSVALLADAGTPLVSDPGYGLAQETMTRGLDVFPLPGPSATLAALVASGLPPDRFMFAGFLPARQSARRSELGRMRGIAATLLWFESPRRLLDALEDMRLVLGTGRRAAVCREMTKLHEDVQRGSFEDLLRHYSANPPRGECVIVVEGHSGDNIGDRELVDMIRSALSRSTLRDTVREIADITGLDRRKIYGRAIEIRDSGKVAGEESQ